jgi:hypothetical protein
MFFGVVVPYGRLLKMGKDADGLSTVSYYIKFVKYNLKG